MNNLDQYLKQCIKFNSKQYLIDKFNQLMFNDIEKDILKFAYIKQLIDYSTLRYYINKIQY